MDNREHLLIVSPSPHQHCGLTTEGMMASVLLALLPACGVAVYLFGLPALRTLSICVVTAVIVEVLWQKASGKQPSFRDGSAALTGLLVAFNLPPSSPWWLALLGSLVAIAVGKQVFGGLGHNLFNPALVARVVLLVSFPSLMTRWSAPQPGRLLADAVTAATPLGEMKSALWLSGRLPPGAGGSLTDYLLGNMAGSLGEVSFVALLAGALYLLWRRVISWHIPVSYLATVTILSGLFWLADPTRFAHPGVHLLTGGLMLGACFMATDLVTSPLTGRGMLLYGCGCGLLTLSIRLFGSYPEGVAFSILFMNATTPLIDRYLVPRPFGSPRTWGTP
ncbi:MULTISPECIES: RnfABCDGE type electron transport complex subunit D [Syntrophotalea]|jgi:electron transport complex protein RnfD|uniref:Ion-translocating oxidoreductase complex subunit D n=1 Tax=Syntrophotalea acetylenica TaxID=29542 RepID=A0A1L3GFK2_SYNAC|nr:RnfABCDGE type electron transport complex subunit D [Syntrophotalea acetylenica]APG24629.1 electron transporter RnfD [Syntrophotalea acetylenica]APG45211.1 electron transporter RnfD [Syntrophotalea acetylenica]MDY0262216.1 RnfABCDGE type electron transport complex subunit D [Syntrophotalea acetylenica]